MKVLALSSGTSADGIDVALAELSDQDGVATMRPLAYREEDWPARQREEILAAMPPAPIDAVQLCRLDTGIGQTFADVAARAVADWAAADVIVSHGQTLAHWTEGAAALGTLQLGSPAWIAAATGTPVVSDLRTADIAHGGHGAPLASTLDGLWLADRPTAAVNIGGIANLTIVGDGRVRTGDTGPGNCLIDAVMQAEHQAPYDAGGVLAATGQVQPQALETLLADEFYTHPLPRSTGRETFDSGYVARTLAAAGVPMPQGADLIATLTELTAATIAAVIATEGAGRVVVSGGGAFNPTLLARLGHHLPDHQVLTSTELGLPVQAKEGFLFALLGYLAARGLPGTIPAGPPPAPQATGSAVPVILGSLTPPAPAPCPPAATAVHTLRLEEGSL
ncbi:MAG TPA: anhydro-N-acetylmuramic acid kinase [Beutenbergiaceae bacterium]|nr:anhydro-N-acetylmuramic acid kinase [Beutenbergiaceae bacterium]